MILDGPIRCYLCYWSSKNCTEFRDKILAQVEAVENVSEDEEDIPRDLLEDKHIHFRSQNVPEDPPPTAVSGSDRIKTGSEFDEDKASLK